MPPLGALTGVSSVKLRTFLKVGSALTVVLAGALLLLSLHAYMTAMVSVAEGGGVEVDIPSEEGPLLVRFSVRNGGLIPIDAYSSATLFSQEEVISTDSDSLGLSPGESGEVSLSLEIPAGSRLNLSDTRLELEFGFRAVGGLTGFEVRAVIRGGGP